MNFSLMFSSVRFAIRSVSVPYPTDQFTIILVLSAQVIREVMLLRQSQIGFGMFSEFPRTPFECLVFNVDVGGV